MAPVEDDDVLDAWRSCGHAVRVKTLDVVVDGASDSGDDSTTVRVRIGTKDVRRAREVEVDPYFFDAGYSVAASTGFARVWEGAEVLSAFLRRAPGAHLSSRFVPAPSSSRPPNRSHRRRRRPPFSRARRVHTSATRRGRRRPRPAPSVVRTLCPQCKP